MVTWRDIQKSLDNVEDDRLDDPAVLNVADDYLPIDLLEVEIAEVGENRLIAYVTHDVVECKNYGDSLDKLNE